MAAQREFDIVLYGDRFRRKTDRGLPGKAGGDARIALAGRS
jgi:hypothetical protein